MTSHIPVISDSAYFFTSFQLVLPLQCTNLQVQNQQNSEKPSTANSDHHPMLTSGRHHRALTCTTSSPATVNHNNCRSTALQYPHLSKSEVPQTDVLLYIYFCVNLDKPRLVLPHCIPWTMLQQPGLRQVLLMIQVAIISFQDVH